MQHAAITKVRRFCIRTLQSGIRALSMTCYLLSGPQAAAAVSGVPQAAINPSVVRLPVVDGRDVRFSRVARTDGLSQTRVTHIVQDSRGFMWFGTQYGLNRYDGYKFKVFKHIAGRSETLSGVYIFALFKDRVGTLWVGCFNSLDRFDPQTEKVTHFRLDPENLNGPAVTVSHISQDRAGHLWLSTGKGLYRLDPLTGAIRRYSHDPEDAASLSNDEVKSTGEDQSGTLWVATREGLDSFDPNSGKVTLHIALQEPRELSFFEDREGHFWILSASGNGLAQLDRASGRLTRYSFAQKDPPGNPLTGVIAMLEDRNGTLWIGTLSDGLLKYDRVHNLFIRYRNQPEDQDSLSENRITTLFEDIEGNIWTGLGASEPNYFPNHALPFSPLPFEHHDGGNLGESLVNALYEDHRGALWIGTTGGVSRLNRQTGAYTHYQFPGHGLSSDVLAIIEDEHGDLWLGTSGQGLYRFNPESGRTTAFRHDRSDPHSLSNDIVHRLYIDRQGALWATTWDGLDRFDPTTNSFEVFRREPSGGAPYQVIAEDDSGNLWLSSTYGIVQFDPKRKQFRLLEHSSSMRQSITDDRTNSILIDHHGDLWAGTQNGLTKIDPISGKLHTYYEEDGLASNAVSCVLNDAQGNLWMSTNQGISRFDIKNKTFRNFTSADGLPGNDLTGWGACFKSARGEMFFGGFAGATAFFPQLVNDINYVPPIVLTEFEINGGAAAGTPTALALPVGATPTIRLSPKQSSFAIEFSALSYRSPSTNRYRYMLEGLDTDWHEVRNDRRLASYTTLAPGPYEFKVQGATSRSAWSEPGARLTILILPPWWATWWFRLVVGVVLLLIGITAYLYRVQQIARQFSLRLDERINERTRIARELHDSLLQGFQGLMLHLQSVSNLLPSRPEEAKSELELALDRGDATIAEGRQTVDDLRSTAQIGRDLVQSLRKLGEELIETVEGVPAPAFRVMVEGRRRLLDSIIRDEVYRIAREALRNSVRHAHATQIEVEVTFSDIDFRLRIRDDGNGIEQGILAKGRRTGHWGLPGMRERAQSMGARLSLWSEKDAGTEVELALPARLAYDKEPGRLGPLLDREVE